MDNQAHGLTPETAPGRAAKATARGRFSVSKGEGTAMKLMKLGRHRINLDHVAHVTEVNGQLYVHFLLPAAEGGAKDKGAFARVIIDDVSLDAFDAAASDASQAG